MREFRIESVRRLRTFRTFFARDLHGGKRTLRSVRVSVRVFVVAGVFVVVILQRKRERTDKVFVGLGWRGEGDMLGL